MEVGKKWSITGVYLVLLNIFKRTMGSECAPCRALIGSIEMSPPFWR